MSFKIVRNDITKIQADAIVNTANPDPIIGKGTDGKIFDAAGREKLLAQRQQIGKIKFGDARITPAFDLPAKFIIHTVAPVWRDGVSGEVDLLCKCYRNSLTLAFENNCKDIVFPLLAAGINNFPKKIALKVAVNEIYNFLMDNDLAVTLTVFDKEVFELSKRIYDNVIEFVEDKEVRSTELTEYSGGGLDHWRIKQQQKHSARVPVKNFRQCLFDMIDERGLTDPQVYKAAQVTSKVFSDIRRRENYTPHKKTAISLALALNLSLEETQKFLATAGYSLSELIDFDAAIIEFINRGVRNVIEVNVALQEKNLPTLEVKEKSLRK